MKRAKPLFVLLALGSLWCAGPQKRKSLRPPEVEVVEISVRRVERLLEIDGRVRNSGERPLRGLILLFDLLASGREVLTTQKGAVEEEVLEPGGEAEFRWQMKDHVRAVSLRVNAVDRSGSELPVKRPGPYPVE